MSLNIYKPVQSLQKSPVATGGICSLTIFKIEDVEQWPEPNPQTGIIDAAIQVKPGKSLYIVQAADKGRTFDEELKYDNAGPYLDIQVEAMLAGHNVANMLTLQTSQFHRWGIIVADRNGVYRLVGSHDSGAKLTYKYNTGDASSSRKVNLSFTWQSPLPAPLYQATVFNISIGGITITAGKLTLIQRFRVGDAGAPMNDGDEYLNNAGFAGKNLLILASTQALPCDDGSGSVNYAGSIERRYEKTFSGSQVHFVGGVMKGEIIEIYAFS